MKETQVKETCIAAQILPVVFGVAARGNKEVISLRSQINKKGCVCARWRGGGGGIGLVKMQ